jgi:predicted DNA-binding transcriptional regulator AlpA
MKTTKPELLTIQELAEESGLAQSTIRDALNNERLPHVVRYGRKLVTRADWEEYRERAKVGRPKKKSVES